MFYVRYAKQNKWLLILQRSTVASDVLIEEVQTQTQKAHMQVASGSSPA